jgi:hypothetical protein
MVDTFLRDETLATGGQADHDDADAGVFDLDANAVSLLRALPALCWPHEVRLRCLGQLRAVLLLGGSLVLVAGDRVLLWCGRHLDGGVDVVDEGVDEKGLF